MSDYFQKISYFLEEIARPVIAKKRFVFPMSLRLIKMISSIPVSFLEPFCWLLFVLLEQTHLLFIHIYVFMWFYISHLPQPDPCSLMTFVDLVVANALLYILPWLHIFEFLAIRLFSLAVIIHNICNTFPWRLLHFTLSAYRDRLSFCLFFIEI